jgi:hypothetical protein
VIGVPATIPNRSYVQVLRWLFAAGLLAAALYSANLTAYHFWAGAYFRTPDQAWHMALAERFFGISMALFIAAVAVAWALRRKRGPPSAK